MSTITQTLPTPAPSRALHYGLWATQVLLALPFLAAGFMKITAPYEELAPGGLSNHWSGAIPRFSPDDFADATPASDRLAADLLDGDL